jgi:hypothetical protein
MALGGEMQSGIIRGLENIRYVLVLIAVFFAGSAAMAATPAISSLVLILKTGQGTAVTLTNNQIIDLTKYSPASYEIRAISNSYAKSIKFFVNGVEDDEVQAPWQTPLPGTVGTYTIKAIPYANADLTGTQGATLTLTLNIIKSVTPTASNAPALTNFVLMLKTGQGTPITLSNNQSIDLAKYSPTSYEVRIGSNSYAKSVKFFVNGVEDDEVQAPWQTALPSKAGTYTIKATPYANADLTGTQGATVSIVLNLTLSTSTSTSSSSSSSGSTSGSTSSGTTSVAPIGYPKLVWAGTPNSSDASYSAFMTRVGLVQKFAETAGAAKYDLATVGSARVLRMTAMQGTHGVNNGVMVKALDKGGVRGGPNKAWVRAKVYWDPNYDYNPYLRDSSGNWTIRDGAGGCKWIGPWGGDIPATADNITNPGWALTLWTGLSLNYITVGMDLNSPRNSSNYAMVSIYRDPQQNLFVIDNNRGRWVQLEWEVQIETAAGGTGNFKFYINGVKGVDMNVRYMNPTSWDPAVGVKGIYLRNWWGGGGTAPKTTPVYYKDLEIWSK